MSSVASYDCMKADYLQNMRRHPNQYEACIAMAEEGGMAKIGVGRDAADVSFLTAYGAAHMNGQTVEVEPA